MKKLLLGLGAVAAVAAPVAAVVGCGIDKDMGTFEMDTDSTKTTAQLNRVDSKAYTDRTGIKNDLGVDLTTLSVGNELVSASWDKATLKLTVKNKATAGGATSTQIYTLVPTDS